MTDLTKSLRRVPVKRRIIELAEQVGRDFTPGDARLNTDLPVSYTWDAAKSYPSTVFVGGITGTLESPGIQRGRPGTDTFTVRGTVVLNGYADLSIAEEDAERWMRAFTDLLALSPRLVNDDIPAGDTAPEGWVQSHKVITYDGPTPTANQPGSSTFGAVAEWAIECITSTYVQT